MFDSDKDKEAQDDSPQVKDEKAKERKEWVRQEIEESKREKRKASGFQKKLIKGLDSRKKAMFAGKFTHGTRGKPTHGPRGNQG